MSYPFSSHELPLLAGHPAWLSMSWEARGMAMQLMALGDFETSGGTLPPEDDIWRSALGFPLRHTIQKAVSQGWATKGSQGLDEAWSQTWRPELGRWFVEIDEHFLRKKPQWSAFLGRFWHPLLDVWADRLLADTKNKGPTSKTAKGARTSKTPKNSKRAGVLDLDRSWDYPAVRYSAGVIKQNWDAPLSQDARMSLWQHASELLSTPGQPRSEAAARVFVGKLIKEHGEKQVAAAVGQLLVRPVRPADPKSFLKKQLQVAEDGGSERVQKARQQRIKVAL